MAETTPVATGIIPPDPSRQFNTISSILGIQQQQQNLQRGAYGVQQAQAQASQAQQENTEKQALAKFTQSAAQDPSYQNADGTPNAQKYQQDAMKVAPVYGQAYIGQMTTNFNSAVENRKALLALSNEQRATIGGYFGAVAAKPGATKDDLLDAADQARGVSSDKGYQRAIDDMLLHMPQTANLPTDQASLTIRQAARQAAVGTNALNAGQSASQMSSVQTAKGVQMVQTSPQNPGGIGPRGAPVAGTLPQVMENLPRMGADDATRYAQVSQEGTNAQTGAQLADQVARYAQEVRTGQYSKEFADKLTIAKQHDPNITARQLLQKYAQQLKTTAEQNAATDASRNQIESGMPSPETMDPDAVSRSAQYVGGIFRMRGARQAYADKYTKNTGSSVGVRGADDSFMRSADPLAFAYQALPAGKARQDFLTQNFGADSAKIHEFVSRNNQLKHYGASSQ